MTTLAASLPVEKFLRNNSVSNDVRGFNSNEKTIMRIKVAAL